VSKPSLTQCAIKVASAAVAPHSAERLCLSDQPTLCFEAAPQSEA